MGGWSAVSISIAFAILAVTYHTVVRPWHLRWGTTPDEATRILPGDDVVPRADTQVTHAISISASASEVWPWIVQMGQTQAGFYSYTWLENLVGCQMTNADEIVPEWQFREVGDPVALHPQAPPLTVLAIDRAELLVLGGRSNQLPADDFRTASNLADQWIWVWAFVLDEHSDQHTRLIVRLRGSWKSSWWASIANYAFGEPAHFIMERKMLLGIKSRVEMKRASKQAIG